MTHRVLVKRENYSWYFNSITHVIQLEKEREPDPAKRMLNENFYDEFFNIKRIFKYGFIYAVDFPTEDDAVMFILRWS